MSCYNCARSFSILTKEKACKNCGFGFCSNCLKHKMILPKTGLEGHVCGACYKAITQPQERPPPDALQRRLDALENPPGPNPITVYTASKSNRRMSNLKRGLSVEDTAIADRLEKLKMERKASMQIPTEAEMEERLSKLKDQPKLTNSTKDTEKDQRNLLLKTDNRSDAEKTKNLLDQANAEVALENKLPKPEEEIADRLAKLRGQIHPVSSKPMEVDPQDFLKDPSVVQIGAEKKVEKMDDLCKLLDEVAMDTENDAVTALKEFENDKELQEKFQNIMSQRSSKNRPDDNADSSEDEEAKAVIEGILSEQSLEEKIKENENPQENDIPELPDVPTFMPTQQHLSRQLQRNLTEEDEKGQELPWCSICNEDAVVRCVKGCDGDLFCSTCFRECHDEMDLKDHKAVLYKAPKK